MHSQHIFAIAACICGAALVAVRAVPLPADRELDVLQIPLANGKEIDVLTVGSHNQEQLIAERNKRTIGLLRELFPDITKEIDAIVNRIIAQVIRVAGPSLLPAILGGNRRTTPRSTDFDSDFDDDDNDNDDDDSNSISNNDSTRVEISLPTFGPDSSDSTTTTTTESNNR